LEKHHLGHKKPRAIDAQLGGNRVVGGGGGGGKDRSEINKERLKNLRDQVKVAFTMLTAPWSFTRHLIVCWQLLATEVKPWLPKEKAQAECGWE